MVTTGKVTNSGAHLAMYRTFENNPTNSAVVYFATGVSTTAASITDSALGKTIPLNSTTYNTCDTTTGWSTEGVATGPSVNTSTGEFKEGTGSLNITTNDSGAATWYRTHTATDFSSKRVWYYYYVNSAASYLQNVSNAVTVTFGLNSTSTNTTSYENARSDLTDGWNVMTFDTATSSSEAGTGVGDLSNITYVGVTTQNNTTVASNNQRMDYIIYATHNDTHQTFVSGWPDFSVEKQITTRGFVDANQANNFLITEFSQMNSDSTKVMWSRDVDTQGISKTNRDEIAVIFTDKASNG